MRILFGIPLILVFTCLYPQEQVIYLIGDAGEYTEPGFALQELERKLKIDTNSNSIVIFLGDNIYKKGISSDYGEEKIDIQLSTIADFKGKSIFIPGNHDWKNGRRTGKNSLNRQREYVDSVGVEWGKSIEFFPKDAAPGPVELNYKYIKVLIIDSQWFIRASWLRPFGRRKHKAFWTKLENHLNEAEKNGQWVLLATHHPLYSIGAHGGRKQPLRFIANNLLFPLNLIGLDRAFNQDIPQPVYKSFRKKLLKVILSSNLSGKKVFYAAGHEHNLQVQQHNSIGFFHIVSGSGSKGSHYNASRVDTRTNRGTTMIFPEFIRETWENPALGYIKMLVYEDKMEIVVKEVYDEKGEVKFQWIKPISFQAGEKNWE